MAKSESRNTGSSVSKTTSNQKTNNQKTSSQKNSTQKTTDRARASRRPNQRKYIRFKPDEGTAALVDQISWGLVVDEAFGGCGLVMLGREKYQPGDLCQIQIGEIGPLRARVAWRLRVSEDVIKIGLEFLE